MIINKSRFINVKIRKISKGEIFCMEHIQQSITNYVESDSKFALLIDGQWGVGKTYFLMNDIIPQLKKNYEPIYISLYGCNSMEEIKINIEDEILGMTETGKKIRDTIDKTEFDNFWFKGARQAINFAFSYRNNTQILKHTGKVVIFIDDLERLSSDISLKDCLGMVNNYFMERLKCKVIFIANTEEIISRPNEEIDFPRMKEKVIDKTLLFNPSSEIIIEKIIESSKSNFISENKDFVIKNIAFFNETINIRSLQSILTNFAYFESIIDNKDLDKDHITLIKKSLFLNNMVLTIEYKEGSLNPNSLKGLGLNSKYVTPPEYNLNELEEEDKQSETREIDNIKECITKKYHNVNKDFDKYIFYFKGIENYIMSGFYDENFFEESYQRWKNAHIPKYDPLNYEALYDFRNMRDLELCNKQKEIISNINNEKYTLIDIIRIYQLFLSFKIIDVLLVGENSLLTIEREIYNRFIKEFNEDIKTYLRIGMDENLYHEMKNLQINIDRLTQEVVFDKSKDLLKAIFENNQDDMALLNQDRYYIHIFEHLDEAMIEDYLFCNNNKAYNLTYYIKNKAFNKKSISNDISRIIRCLENRDINSFEKVDKLKLKELIQELKNIKGNIEQYS